MNFSRGHSGTKVRYVNRVCFPKENTPEVTQKGGRNSWTFRFGPFFGLVCQGDSWGHRWPDAVAYGFRIRTRAVDMKRAGSSSPMQVILCSVRRWPQVSSSICSITEVWTPKFCSNRKDHLHNYILGLEYYCHRNHYQINSLGIFPVMFLSKFTELIVVEFSPGNSLQDFVHGISVRVSWDRWTARCSW